jgi:hypothetical protein
MDINAACHAILGDELANAIITDQGTHWAVVTAMAQATTDDDPRAIAAIREWIGAARSFAEHERQKP